MLHRLQHDSRTKGSSWSREAAAAEGEREAAAEEEGLRDRGSSSAKETPSAKRRRREIQHGEEVVEFVEAVGRGDCAAAAAGPRSAEDVGVVAEAAAGCADERRRENGEEKALGSCIFLQTKATHYLEVELLL